MRRACTAGKGAGQLEGARDRLGALRSVHTALLDKACST